MRAKNKMSEFFLELFSEEIPAKLQVDARKSLLENFKNFFDENKIHIKDKCNAFSGALVLGPLISSDFVIIFFAILSI